MKLRILSFFALVAFAVTSCDSEPEVNPGTTPLTIAPPGLMQVYEVQSPEDNPLTVEGVELGRMLFYEKRLSANNTMSCGTCHQQKHAFTDGLALSPGVDGLPGTRNTMSLTNVGWDKNLMWDGKFNTLEEQIKGPVENPVEMHQSFIRGVNKLQNTDTYPKLFQKAFGSKIITEENISKALAQFERTLISGNSKYDQYKMGKATLTPDELAGEQLFFDPHTMPGTSRSANCFDCHGGPNFSRKLMANNGLDREFNDPGLGGVTGKATDMGKFKAPTLRNIELTAPYMHDGRFTTLEEVMNHYNSGVKKDSPNLHIEMMFSNTGNPAHQLDLTEPEVKQVIAFLKTLTDHDFVTNPAFSDPFAQTGPVK